MNSLYVQDNLIVLEEIKVRSKRLKVQLCNQKNERTCKNNRIDFDSRIAMRFLSDNLLAKLSIERLSWVLIQLLRDFNTIYFSTKDF